MSATKITARIIAAVAAVVCAVSCGTLLGDYEVDVPPLVTEGPLTPAVICELGTTRCDGRLLQLCSDEGTAWATLEACATPDLCRASDTETVSSCIPPACSAEQMSCDGSQLRLCNVARTGWELFATCESAAHCDAGRRQCQPAPCEPGARRCNLGNLERCNDDRTGWELLDACVTNELCEATITPAAVIGEVLSTSDLTVPEPASNAEGPTECRGPVCVPREVRCDVNRLNACNEGQTDLGLAEECATPKLCDASITYTGLRGSPRCVRPTCAPGEHRCSDVGVLEVCNADRDGFDPIEACIGPQFCNAVAADNGEPGCEDAPCEAGEQQCNGPQIQRCLDDRTGFESIGEPCETRGLCNDDGATAFCALAQCQRGPLSGTEFLCQGATLLRCNDQHTGYDPLSTCATAGLCNAGLGFNGCQPPVCAPGETRCNGNFVQRCNADRTGFENVEQCQAGTCDSALGRCADPCVQGSARCNAQGNLEECRNLLVGREITARCGSVQLCDAGARTCRTPPAGCTADGVRRCRTQGAGSVLEQCADGRSRFATLDTCEAGEVCDANDVTCDACVQGAQPTCEGNVLVSCSANGKDEARDTCANGCQTVADGPDRCRSCVPGSTRCENDQLVVCRQDGNEEVLVREFCDSAEICQNTLAACNAAGSGQNCRCQACVPSDRGCDGTQPVACNNDRSAIVPVGTDCGARGCNPQTGACFACALGDVSCSAGVLVGCASDRSGFTQPLGAIRCIESNGPDRAQSCSGGTLVNEECPSDICDPNSGGCAECDSDDFNSACALTPDGRPGITQCVGGNEVVEACDGGDGCVEATCAGGGCTFRSAAAGLACQRNGGAAGKCDGNGSCVECLLNSDCRDDGDQCTQDFCGLDGTCQHPPVVCPDDNLACNGTATCDSRTGCGTTAPRNCADTDPCTVDACVESGGGLSSCSNTPKQCAANEECNATSGQCVPLGCRNDQQCDDDIDCTTDTCNTTTGACSNIPSNAACDDGIACTVDTCASQTGCQSAPNDSACPDSNPCDGTNVCNPERGCVAGNAPVPDSCQLNGGGTGQCANGQCQPICDRIACDAQDVPPCVDFGCSADGQCVPRFTTDACGNGGTCSNGVCAGETPLCDPAACNLQDNLPCVDFQCQGNDCVRTTPNVACGNGGTCSDGVCQQPQPTCDPTACNLQDNLPCVDFQCQGSDCVRTTPSVACGNAGTCSNGTCQEPQQPPPPPPPQCNPAQCNLGDQLPCVNMECQNDACLPVNTDGALCNNNTGVCTGGSCQTVVIDDPGPEPQQGGGNQGGGDQGQQQGGGQDQGQQQGGGQQGGDQGQQQGGGDQGQQQGGGQDQGGGQRGGDQGQQGGGQDQGQQGGGQDQGQQGGGQDQGQQGDQGSNQTPVVTPPPNQTPVTPPADPGTPDQDTSTDGTTDPASDAAAE